MRFRPLMTTIVNLSRTRSSSVKYPFNDS
jgi:hypothetical protein